MELRLNRNKVALIDDADWPLVSQHHWSTSAGSSGIWYAKAKVYDADGKRKTILMHRVILGAAPRQVTDHKNGNGLDNRRENIRFATYLQNNRNRRRDPHRTYKGTFLNRTLSRDNPRPWTVRIRISKERRLTVCGFATEIEAARAYDDLARQHHGEFARLNFPTMSVPPTTRGHRKIRVMPSL